MAPPPTLNYMRRSVGAFLLIGAVIAGAAILQSGRIQSWFNPGRRLVVQLPPEGSFGLQAGAQVKMLGTDAGRVLDVRIDREGRMTAEIEVRSDFAHFVRTDSSATIRKVFGVAGDAYLEVSRGTMADLEGEDAVIMARTDQAPTETLQLLVEELRGSVVPAVGEARAGIEAWTGLAKLLQDPDREFVRTFKVLGELADRLARGEGALGRLLSNEETADRLRSIVMRTDDLLEQLGPILDNLEKSSADIALAAGVMRGELENAPGIALQMRQTLESLQAVMADAEKTTRELPGLIRDVRDVTSVTPMLVLEARQAIRDLDKFLQGLQQHWLFRDSMPADDGDRSPKPDEVLP